MSLLDKYKYINTPNIKQQKEVKRSKEESKVVAPLILEDNRVLITLEEKELLDTCVLVHNLSLYRRRPSTFLLPNIDVSMDILLWDREEFKCSII